jgi:hypothetical protein
MPRQAWLSICVRFGGNRVDGSGGGSFERFGPPPIALRKDYAFTALLMPGQFVDWVRALPGQTCGRRGEQARLLPSLAFAEPAGPRKRVGLVPHEAPSYPSAPCSMPFFAAKAAPNRARARSSASQP